MISVTDPESGSVRIGELSRRVGLSDHVLRAWETRYGLMHPTRSAGGFRLYSRSDERRVRRMQELMATGLSAAEAAHEVTSSAGPPADDIAPARIDGDLQTLRDALARFDEPAAQAVLDQLVSSLSLPTVLRDVVMPYLHDLGERWARGQATVAEEHFASNVIRGRLAGLARGWGAGNGPRAVLACPPGEIHDLSLLVFGIALNRTGWNVTFLGADTPIADLTHTIEAAQPDLVVLAATVPERFEPIVGDLATIGRDAALAIAGAGATTDLAQRAFARVLAGDPVTEAQAEADRVSVASRPRRRAAVATS